MNSEQYILMSLKATGQLYVLNQSPLHQTCRCLEEQRRVAMRPERSPVGTIWRVTAPEKGEVK